VDQSSGKNKFTSQDTNFDNGVQCGRRVSSTVRFDRFLWQSGVAIPSGKAVGKCRSAACRSFVLIEVAAKLWPKLSPRIDHQPACWNFTPSQKNLLGVK
jgi:hypothetical protein